MTDAPVHCSRHPATPVTRTACRSCGTFLCGLCSLWFEGATFCPPCWEKRLAREAGNGLLRAVLGSLAALAAWGLPPALIVVALVAPEITGPIVGLLTLTAAAVFAATGTALCWASVGRPDVPGWLPWPGLVIGAGYLVALPVFMIVSVLLVV